MGLIGHALGLPLGDGVRLDRDEREEDCEKEREEQPHRARMKGHLKMRGT